MRETRIIMGMPITVAALGEVDTQVMADVFAWFDAVDERFSTYLVGSEISQFNRGEISGDVLSAEMLEVFALARRTKEETQGFFDMRKADGSVDPSGIVKGWAINKAAQLMRAAGVEDFFVDAGGDIQAEGMNEDGEDWRVGIRSPFQMSEIIKVVAPQGQGMATSGSYVRGCHIWNPLAPRETLSDVVSITVLGPDILEADRFATAAFAMGPDGIYFIESLPGFEAYQVNAQGIATQTSNFKDYVIS
ncbi:MAG: FAD:protein FMN transferase [Aestuariivirga sp.]